jgi:hypothetical protein
LNKGGRFNRGQFGKSLMPKAKRQNMTKPSAQEAIRALRGRDPDRSDSFLDGESLLVLGDGDRRPFWERVKPAEGMPTWEALFHFVDPRRAVALYHLELGGYDDEEGIDHDWPAEDISDFRQKNFRHKWLLRELGHELYRKLRWGEVSASGFTNHSALDAPRRPIAPERWVDLDLNVRESAASGPGIEVTQILIFPRRRSATEPLSSPRHSPAAVRKWYQRHVKDYQAAGRIPSRDDDYADANREFGGGVGRRAVQSLRRELAPDSWTRPGRRKRVTRPK